MTTVAERAERAKVDKFTQRRDKLAESALMAIAERGYARTGLRDVAQHSDLSHGVLHYYFADKDDLIALAVWNYKSACARRYDRIVETAVTPSELLERVCAAMATTLREDVFLHRLWYDLRNQALFNPGFHDTIIAIDELLEQMVWAIVERYAHLANRSVIATPQSVYALFDGLFQNGLIRSLRGQESAEERLSEDMALILRSVTAP
jgi:AcrR family transcriptional regulator